MYRVLLWALLWAAGLSAAQAQPTGGDPAAGASHLTPMRVGGRLIAVELALRPEEQARGLMFRERLPENQGMLFVYPSAQRLAFWMRNTWIPLDIAFIDGQGIIVSIQPMAPMDDRHTHVSPSPVPYALEMNQGWFEQNGVAVGDRVELPFP